MNADDILIRLHAAQAAFPVIQEHPYDLINAAVERITALEGDAARWCWLIDCIITERLGEPESFRLLNERIEAGETVTKEMIDAAADEARKS